ncbi:MAG: hypothetical protein JNL80_17940 [Phycisphaerae bacterium]|nr:hypothetical protein [Phycisphaerae bacterium]
MHVHGRFAFERIVEASPALVGAARMRVEVWDQDDFSDELMASTYTDLQGFYDLTFSWDDCDIVGCDDPDIYVIVRAMNDHQDVQRDDLLQTTYAWSSEAAVLEDVTVTDVNMGVLIPGPTDEQGAAHVHTILALARDALVPVGISPHLPALEVDWSAMASDSGQDGTRISLSGPDGWSEVEVARLYLLYFFEHRFNEPLDNLCNGICDDDGCGSCLWCIEAPEAAWRIGASTWFGDALSRAIPATTGAQPLVTLPEIDAVFPCPDGLPVNPSWVAGYAAAILRDLEDNVEILDVDGDGDDDAPAETSCERDSLGQGFTATLELLFELEFTDLDDFASFLPVALPDDGAVWRTLRRIGGDQWTAADTTAPVVTGVLSSTHPDGSGQFPLAEASLFAVDFGSGVAGYSVDWSVGGAIPDTVVDLVASPNTLTITASPLIPFGSQLILTVRAVDCVGNWSAAAAFGPFTVSDCDFDGFPDFCAVGACDLFPGYCPESLCGAVADCDGNLVPDSCDITTGATEDCNQDLIPDSCQGEVNNFQPPPGLPSLWNVPSSWSTGALPGASQIACLDLNAANWVTRLTGLPAQVFAFGCDHTLELLTTLSISASSNTQQLSLLGGTITGTGDLQANNISWSSGTIGQPAGASASLLVGSITTSTSGSKTLNRDTNVYFGMDHEAGPLVLNNSRVLHLLLGTFNTIGGNTSIVWGSGNRPTLLNESELRKVGPGVATVSSVNVTNDGFLYIDEGRLDVGPGSTSGVIEIADGATLRLAGDLFTAASTSTITGGAVECQAGTKTLGGSVDVDTFAIAGGSVVLDTGVSMTADVLSMTSGTLEGAGSAGAGLFEWSSGILAGSGELLVEDTLFTGTGQKNVRRSLSIGSVATHAGSSIGLSEGGTLRLLPGGLMDITANGGFTWISGSQAGTFINQGTVRKSGPIGVSQWALVGVENPGTIDVQSGTIRLTGTSVHSGSVLGAADATFDLGASNHGFGTASTVDVGTFLVSGGTVGIFGSFTPDLLAITSGTCAIEATASAEVDAMTFTSGSLSGAGQLTVNGPLTWNGGYMVGTGMVELLGISTLSGAGQRAVRRPVTVRGAMEHLAGVLGVDVGGTLTIAEGAEFRAGGGTTLTWIAGGAPGAIEVDGTLRKLNDTGQANWSFVPVTVDGTMSLEGGTFQFSAPLTVNGSAIGASASELHLNGAGPHYFASSASIDLSTLRLGSTTATFDAPASVDALILQSGTATINGETNVGSWTQTNGVANGSGFLTVTGPFTFNSGSINGSNSMDVFGPAAFTGPGGRSFGRLARFHDNVLWSAGTIAINQGMQQGTALNGFVSIEPTGSLTVAGAGLNATWAVGSSGGAFLNEGLMTLQPGSGTTTFSFLTFLNAGTIDVAGPRLFVNASPQVLQSSGTLLVRAGCEFETNSVFHVNGGTLTGDGSIDSNVLMNGGSVAPGVGIGTLTIDGTLTLAAPVTLDLAIGSSEQDHLTIMGNAALNGYLRPSLIDGFVPEIGASFEILTCTARTGTFIDVVPLTPLPNDRRWVAVYDPDSVTILVVPALPCAGDLDLDGNVGQIDLAILLGAWGTDGSPAGADLTEDGVVSAPDLAILLGAWGPCPTGDTDDASESAGGIAMAQPEQDPPARTAAAKGRRARSPQDAQAPRSSDLVDLAHGNTADLTPTFVDGDFRLDAESFESRLVTSLIVTEDGCAIDASLLLIDGEASLEGTLTFTLDDTLELEPGTCLRVLIARSIVGVPTVKVFHRDAPISVDVEVGVTTLDLHVRGSE